MGSQNLNAHQDWEHKLCFTSNPYTQTDHKDLKIMEMQIIILPIVITCVAMKVDTKIDNLIILGFSCFLFLQCLGILLCSPTSRQEYCLY